MYIHTCYRYKCIFKEKKNHLQPIFQVIMFIFLPIKILKGHKLYLITQIKDQNWPKTDRHTHTLNFAGDF